MNNRREFITLLGGARCPKPRGARLPIGFTYNLAGH